VSSHSTSSITSRGSQLISSYPRLSQHPLPIATTQVSAGIISDLLPSLNLSSQVGNAAFLASPHCLTPLDASETYQLSLIERRIAHALGIEMQDPFARLQRPPAASKRKELCQKVAERGVGPMNRDSLLMVLGQGLLPVQGNQGSVDMRNVLSSTGRIMEASSFVASLLVGRLIG
jgi:hypothetical protein